jgi:RHS repeat-associated protein
MEGNWNGASGENKYAYNGKEWNDDFGLGMNDYGARYYDPAMARFTTADPLAEMYSGMSAYHYVMNNPIKFVDPTGMASEAYSFGSQSSEKNSDEIMQEQRQKLEDSKKDDVAVSFTGQEAKDALSVFKGEKTNVLVNVEQKGIREQTTSGYYSSTAWAVFAVSSLSTAAKALSAFGDNTLDNLVIGAHGADNKIDPTPDNNTVNSKGNTVSPDYVNAGSSGSVKGMMNKVKPGGNVVFAVCDLGKGSGGQKVSKQLGDASGNTKNIYIATGLTRIPTEGAGSILLNGALNYGGVNWIQNSRGSISTLKGNISITTAGLIIK